MASLADSTAWPQDSSSRAGCPDPPGAGESPIGRGSISPGSGARPRPVRVIQARPPEEPTTTAGITSEDPGESGSKAKLPNAIGPVPQPRSEEHTSELQSLRQLVCRLLLEKKKRARHRSR